MKWWPRSGQIRQNQSKEFSGAPYSTSDSSGGLGHRRFRIFRLSRLSRLTGDDGLQDPDLRVLLQVGRPREGGGFHGETIDQSDLTALKADLCTKALSSCFAAVVDGYVIEGHVPAADIKRLLKERLKTTGLAAPGMPGAGRMDTSKEPYDVLPSMGVGRPRCGQSISRQPP